MTKKPTYALRQDIFAYAADEYDTQPEYLWARYPDAAVLRRPDNDKWYALVMDVRRDKLGLPGKEKVDILNVKCDQRMKGSLLMTEGIFPAYHMNKGSWITLLLDGTVELELVRTLLKMSYDLTASPMKKAKPRLGPKEWLIPANPKYYDVEHAFDHTDTITWKQGAGIVPGDTVYLYVAAPVSAVLFKCDVLETDIPYNDTGELRVKKIMRIKLQHRFAYDELTFKRLNEFGVNAVRGPRGVPHSLSCEMKRLAVGN